MEEVNIIIIGAGVVGLAVAAKLSETFTDIIVIERQDSFGRETSSRNSEVIHSGIYYPSKNLNLDYFSPDMVGIRPKLSGPNDALRDFIISEESGIGLPGFINLIGIESPGLTSCLSIANKVAQLLKNTI